jgi:phosphoribosylformylglycinamidine synthase
MVRTNTIVGPGSDAAVIYLKDTNKALAVKTDCNARYVYLNPREGTRIAVSEAARNVVCSGGVPLGITNCLNFGNPYKPEMYWQFKEAIEGMGEACRFFETPVTGGNVSFYNESPNAAVYPTPTIGMVGLVEDLTHVTTAEFKNEGDLIFLLGEDNEEVGGSEYLKVMHDLVTGEIPKVDLKKEKLLQKSILDLIAKGLINSAHDISEGGILCALAECCIVKEEKKIGAYITIPVKTREDFTFFSESQGRVIISVSPGHRQEVENSLKQNGQKYSLLGTTGGSSLKLNNKYNLDLNYLSGIYFNAIARIMNE